jgi:hypothetical protein
MKNYFFRCSYFIFLNAQKKEQDSLNTRTIEDVKLHKTGNPNKAKISTTKSNLNVWKIHKRLLW